MLCDSPYPPFLFPLRFSLLFFFKPPSPRETVSARLSSWWAQEKMPRQGNLCLWHEADTNKDCGAMAPRKQTSTTAAATAIVIDHHLQQQRRRRWRHMGIKISFTSLYTVNREGTTQRLKITLHVICCLFAVTDGEMGRSDGWVRLEPCVFCVCVWLCEWERQRAIQTLMPAH